VIVRTTDERPKGRARIPSRAAYFCGLVEWLARRDVLRLRHAVISSAADASAGREHGGFARQLRSELKMLSALPVAELREQADGLARDIRELDVRIQRSNWEVDLVD
jgi:hypothetical protein